MSTGDDHPHAFAQPTPLWLTFPHLGRTYRVIGWEHHNGNYCPIILNIIGPRIGLGNTIHSLGSGSWPIQYSDTYPDNPGDS